MDLSEGEWLSMFQPDDATEDEDGELIQDLSKVTNHCTPIVVDSSKPPPLRLKTWSILVPHDYITEPENVKTE